MPDEIAIEPRSHVQARAAETDGSLAFVILPLSPVSPVALLLPGRAYTVNHPTIYSVAAVARDLGWRIEAVEWDPDDESDEAVVAQGREALNAVPTGRSVVIGKSLGSLLLLDVAELALRAVWLTPILTREDVRRAAMRRSAPAFLVGGTADDVWHSDAAHTTGHDVMELNGGNHRLELDGDAIGSARRLVSLATRVLTLFTSLPQA